MSSVRAAQWRGEILLAMKVRDVSRAKTAARPKTAAGRGVLVAAANDWGTGAAVAGCVALGLLVAWAFAPALSNGFVEYDDQLYVVRNWTVQQGLSWVGLKCAFAGTHVSSNWHPLTSLSHMLDVQLFGMQAWGHHLTSLLVHGLSTVLLFLVLRAATGAAGRSWLAAAFFGLHPLRVESVAWVAERKDVLSVCFGLLAVWAYVVYAKSKVQGPKSKVAERPATHHASRITVHISRFYLLSLLCFALSLMSKSMLVTLPFALLLLDYWPLRRLSFPLIHPSTHPPIHSSVPPLRLVLEKLPFLGLAAAASVVTYLVQQKANLIWSALPWGARAANALVSYSRYLANIFWPVGLNSFYPLPARWPAGTVAAAAAVVAAITLAVLWRGRRQPYLLVGWLWFLGTLVPALGLVQVGAQAMADRYTYWPSVGVAVMVIWGAAELCARAPWRGVAVTAAVAGVVVCGALTRAQIGPWGDTELLFRQSLAHGGENARTLNYLGAVLDMKGKSAEAIADLRRAATLEPQIPVIHYNLGLALCRAGQLEAALAEFRTTVELQPLYAEAHSGLGYTLLQLGRATEAVRAYQESLRLEPDSVETHNSLGAALDRLERLDEAMAQYREALRLDPDSSQAHSNLGAAFAKRGRSAEALTEFRAAVSLRPDYAPGEVNLGNALAASGQPAEAESHYQAALRLAPEDARARYHYGLLLVKQGRRQAAADEFREALRLRPSLAAAREQLSVLEGAAPK